MRFHGRLTCWMSDTYPGNMQRHLPMYPSLACVHKTEPSEAAMPAALMPPLAEQVCREEATSAHLSGPLYVVVKSAGAFLGS